MNQSRKDIQRIRMWQYFIDAATEVIEEEGMENVTIRKVADLAGYTSSTAYNYFEDLSHMKFFAALRFIKPYTEDLPRYIEQGENTLEQWLYTWKCFLKHSFERPFIYQTIFLDDLGDASDEMLSRYYQIYPEDLISVPTELQGLLKEESFSKRSENFIFAAAEEGFIDQRDLASLAEITHMIWVGALTLYINKRKPWTKEAAIDYVYTHVHKTVMTFVKPAFKDKINIHHL